MSERNVSLLLLDIKVPISKILEYTKGMSFEAYEADSKTKDAVERNFEIIGEASSRIPDSFRQQHPGIEWRIIKDFRNFIIHEYFGINNQIVWDIIQYRCCRIC
ncbi:DUF86 domain-containing protein [Chitinophaga sp. YIM B06452]|uniref:HepT-like ribonuclease domain-containing protein n=1 Tax=Chitinophaga sp. YIM B06452 TaxID=3082158 RepID=UPI0031FE62E6